MNNERNLNQLGLSLYLGKGSGGEGGGKVGGVFWGFFGWMIVF